MFNHIPGQRNHRIYILHFCKNLPSTLWHQRPWTPPRLHELWWKRYRIPRRNYKPNRTSSPRSKNPHLFTASKKWFLEHQSNKDKQNIGGKTFQNNKNKVFIKHENIAKNLHPKDKKHLNEKGVNAYNLKAEYFQTSKPNQKREGQQERFQKHHNSKPYINHPPPNRGFNQPNRSPSLFQQDYQPMSRNLKNPSSALIQLINNLLRYVPIWKHKLTKYIYTTQFTNSSLFIENYTFKFYYFYYFYIQFMSFFYASLACPRYCTCSPNQKWVNYAHAGPNVITDFIFSSPPSQDTASVSISRPPNPDLTGNFAATSSPPSDNTKKTGGNKMDNRNSFRVTFQSTPKRRK